MEPVKDFEQCDEIFRKINLASTADKLIFQKVVLGYPPAPHERICFVHFAVRWSILALLFETSLCKPQGRPKQSSHTLPLI